jgi:hypothetical protein
MEQKDEKRGRAHPHFFTVKGNIHSSCIPAQKASTLKMVQLETAIRATSSCSARLPQQ